MIHLAWPSKLGTSGSKSVYALVSLLVVFDLLLMSVPIVSASSSNDDLFGINYDSHFVPSSTKGIEVQYISSTAGVTLTSGYLSWCTLISGSGAGSIGTVATVHTSGGYVLQGGATLVTNSSGKATWFMGWGYFDNSNNWYCGTLKALSASTWTTLSGTEEIYYTGSAWELKVYSTQTGATYTYTYPSNIGTTVDGSSQDWNAAETTASQTGVTLSSSFGWEITYPEFLVSGSWQGWNISGGTYKELSVNATVQPYTINYNNIGIAFMSTPGVYIQIGQSASNQQTNTWCISGTCPNTVARH